MKKIIVLIPHFNNPTGLLQSIRSMQTEFSLVDILVIDDGSKNEVSQDLLRNTFGESILVLNNRINRGIEYVLNDGLNYAVEHGYIYIARLDCGDLCVENRFQIQYDFLKCNPTISVIGSHVKCVDTEGNYLYNLKMPLTDAVIRKKMFLNAMLIHPTLFFRIEVVLKVGLYPTEYKNAEDYAFFFKLLPYFKFANIDKELVQIELNPNGISNTGRIFQLKSRIRIIKENFYFGFYPIYGLVRAYTLLIVPNSLIKKLKALILK